MRPATYVGPVIRDLTDDEARRALPVKWGSIEPGVLPAWIAEMDYAVAEPITEALHAAVADGVFGYPTMVPGGELGFGYRTSRFKQEPGRWLVTWA